MEGSKRSSSAEHSVYLSIKLSMVANTEYHIKNETVQARNSSDQEEPSCQLDIDEGWFLKFDPVRSLDMIEMPI